MTRWWRLPLRRVARVVNGGTPTSDEANWGGDIPWATPVDIGAANGRIIQTQRTLTRVGAMSGSRIVPAESVLVSTRAPIGYVAIADKPMAFNQGCRALVPSALIDARFLYYQLSVLSAELNRRGLGTTFLELSAANLADVEVAVPPLDQQRRIADFLDVETARLDSLRLLTGAQLLLLEERLLASMRELTTGGVTERRPTRISWMPSIARSWRVGKVSHLFVTGSGTTPAAGNPDYFDGDLSWVSSSEVNNAVINSTSRSITAAAVRDFPALKRYAAGSLVIAMYGQGETKGRVGILGINAYVNQACCVLVPTGIVTARFAFYWFRAHKPGVVSLALGAGQPNLSQELIRDVRIPVPKIATQEVIAEEMFRLEQSIESQREALRRRNSLLAERRQALITAAVTGQFDVTTGRSANLW